jgi:hypothetical protein
MKRQTSFVDGDRYAFDFNHCSAKRGFAQVDTGQDAWYFGTWANPTRLMVVSYCEGDLTIETAESRDEFVAAVRRIKSWNEEQGHGFSGIDAMCNEEIAAGFRALGLGDLLH